MMISKDKLTDHGDSLDDFLGERTESLRAPASIPENYQPKSFDEPCAACRGTGTFRSYTGRLIGPCFKCKGAGKKTFKTSPETRATSRENNAARVQRTKDEARASFKAEYPDVWAWLDGNAFDFAVSLKQSLEKYGSLTDGQIAAVRRAIEKRDAIRAEREAVRVAAPEISMEKIEAAFSTARENGLTRLKIRIAGLTFQPAPAHGTNAGALYVKRDMTYLGKIAGGKFVRSRDCDDATQGVVLSIAADPKAAAVAHGKLTGSCSCCGRTLTDPVSIERGIGPICETRVGW